MFYTDKKRGIFWECCLCVNYGIISEEKLNNKRKNITDPPINEIVADEEESDE